MNHQDLLKYCETGMSEYQKDYFVTIKNGGTVWGMFRQSLRELKTRVSNLESLEIEMEELELMTSLSKFLSFLPIFSTRYKSKKNRLRDMKERKSFLEHDIKQFKCQASICYDILKKSGCDIDSIKGRYKLEQEEWYFKSLERIHLDLLSTGNISRQTHEMVSSLDTTSRNRIEKLLISGGDTFEGVMNKIGVEIEKLKFIPKQEQLDFFEN